MVIEMMRTLGGFANYEVLRPRKSDCDFGKRQNFPNPDGKERKDKQIEKKRKHREKKCCRGCCGGERKSG